MFDEYMLTKGFSTSQIESLHKIYPPHIYPESTLLYNTRNLENYFHKNCIQEESFKKIIMTIPNILSLSIENIKIKIEKLKQLGFTKLEVIHLIESYPYILEISNQKINNKINLLKELGIKKEEIILIINKYPKIFRIENQTIRKKYEMLIAFGLSKKNTNLIIIKIPEIMEISSIQIEKRITEFQNMGFTKNQTKKIFTIVPYTIINDVNIIKDKFQFLIEFGLKEKEIIHLIQAVPIILKSTYLETIKEKIDCLKKCQFTTQEIISIITINPYILLYSTDNIETKINELNELDFSKKETKNILVLCPILFGYDITNIKNKISFYKDINVLKQVLEQPNILLLNIEYINKRYSFLKSINKTQNLKKDLFLTDKDFTNLYNITRKEIWEVTT